MKKIILTIFFLLSTITSIFCQNYTIKGKWKDSNDIIYEFRKNTILKGEKEYPAEYKEKKTEWIISVTENAVKVNYVLRKIDAETMTLITPYGYQLLLTKFYKENQNNKNMNYDDIKIEMIHIPGKDYKILKTEVTQNLYETVMGENPSTYSKSRFYPVESVSLYDAIYFCNKLSELKGLKPVYSVNGTTDVTKWNYEPHTDNIINGKIERNRSANGYRLPTYKEWLFAAKGGEEYFYSGSNNINEVGWYENNSNKSTHFVGSKKSNGYGLYDMTGNVFEWCWSSELFSNLYHICGGSYASNGDTKIDDKTESSARKRYSDVGFRIVASSN